MVIHMLNKPRWRLVWYALLVRACKQAELAGILHAAKLYVIQ